MTMPTKESKLYLPCDLCTSIEDWAKHWLRAWGWQKAFNVYSKCSGHAEEYHLITSTPRRKVTVNWAPKKATFDAVLGALFTKILVIKITWFISAYFYSVLTENPEKFPTYCRGRGARVPNRRHRLVKGTRQSIGDVCHTGNWFDSAEGAQWMIDDGLLDERDIGRGEECEI